MEAFRQPRRQTGRSSTKPAPASRFYNATATCAAGSLSLVPAGTAVFADVAPGSNKNRSVNPVTATIRAACTGSAAPDLALSGMEVGGSYSVWLMQPAATPLAFISRDTTLPYKK